MKTQHDIALENGEIVLNVEAHSTSTLIAIFADIAVEMISRYSTMSQNDRNDYVREIENITFIETLRNNKR